MGNKSIEEINEEIKNLQSLDANQLQMKFGNPKRLTDEELDEMWMRDQADRLYDQMKEGQRIW